MVKKNNNVKVMNALINSKFSLDAGNLAIESDIKRPDVAAKSAREMVKLSDSGIMKIKRGRKTFYQIENMTTAREFLNKLATKKVKMFKSKNKLPKKIYPIEDVVSLDNENTRVIFKQGKKYGIKDSNNNFIVEPKHSFISILVNYEKTIKMGLILSD